MISSRNSLARAGVEKATIPHLNLSVIYRPITSLLLDPKNPREHAPKQVRQLAASIDTFGMIVPILVDANFKVLCGHGRILASELLGIQEVPTITVDHLTSVQARAFLIADNRLTEIATWDDALLAEHFQILSSVELDFSLDVTGFDMGEIDVRIQSFESPARKADPADSLSAPMPGPAVTVPEDVWRLGRHRLLCADALDPASYTTLMNCKRATMVCCDPPYNVAIAGNVSGLGAIVHREFAMASGEMNRPEFTGFLTRFFSHLVNHSIDGSLHYVFIDWRHLGEMTAAGDSVYTELKNVCVWVKDNGGMGSFYRSRHEMVFVWKSGNGAHQNHVQLGQFGRNRTNIWEYASANSFSRATDEGNLLALHPTVKPVALIADAIMDASRRGDIVLDPFVGSGTTIIAAERVGRVAFAMEIDPVYVDAAVRRWQAYTGDRAVHAVTGQSFDERASTRGADHD
ncbi:MAG: site-specific DNA-methyltransferase [Rudaea sp.]|nr:site-specific DNA-methyltransferase [Rudaea sp.]